MALKCVACGAVLPPLNIEVPHDRHPLCIKCELLKNAKTTKIGPLSTQVGGDHYKKQKVQPVELMYHNSIPYAEGNAIKYLSRYMLKNGRQDVEKALHYGQLILELRRKKPDPVPIRKYLGSNGVAYLAGQAIEILADPCSSDEDIELAIKCCEGILELQYGVPQE